MQKKKVSGYAVLTGLLYIVSLGIQGCYFLMEYDHDLYASFVIINCIVSEKLPLFSENLFR